MRFKIYAIAAFIILRPAVAFPESAPAAPAAASVAPLTTDSAPSSLEQLLVKMDEVHANLSTLTVDFTQVKTLRLLTEPMIADGHFYYTKPDRVAWIYGGQDAMSMIVNRDKMVMYYPDLKQADRVDISRYRNKVFRTLSLGQSSKVLRKQYKLALIAEFDPKDPAQAARYLPEDIAKLSHPPTYERKLFVLDLLPKKSGMARKVTKITLWIEEGRWLPVLLRYARRNGDTSVMFFRDIRLNVAIDDARYDLTLPADVLISDRIEQREPGEEIEDEDEEIADDEVAGKAEDAESGLPATDE